MGPEFELYKGIVITLGLSNHAINFVLYAVTSSNFRKEFKNLCRPIRAWCIKTRTEGKVVERGEASKSVTSTKQSNVSESVPGTKQSESSESALGTNHI